MSASPCSSEPSSQRVDAPDTPARGSRPDDGAADFLLHQAPCSYRPNVRPDPSQRERFPVIAVVASAGGIEALSTVLGGLPDDLPAAVLVVQHLAPTGPELLPRLLAARTVLPVRAATDGECLEAGTIYVCPPGHHVLIGPTGVMSLIISGQFPPSRPSGDLTLVTLATAMGPRAIAVVLTGEGLDAATGVTAVHHFGGTVIACHPDSAQAEAMPKAAIARDDAVDEVVSLTDIAPLLVNLTTAPRLRAVPQAPLGAFEETV